MKYKIYQTIYALCILPLTGLTISACLATPADEILEQEIQKKRSDRHVVALIRRGLSEEAAILTIFGNSDSDDGAIVPISKRQQNAEKLKVLLTSYPTQAPQFIEAQTKNLLLETSGYSKSERIKASDFLNNPQECLERTERHLQNTMAQINNTSTLRHKLEEQIARDSDSRVINPRARRRVAVFTDMLNCLSANLSAFQEEKGIIIYVEDLVNTQYYFMLGPTFGSLEYGDEGLERVGYPAVPLFIDAAQIQFIKNPPQAPLSIGDIIVGQYVHSYQPAERKIDRAYYIPKPTL